MRSWLRARTDRGSEQPQRPRLTLLDRAGCHLCVAAQEVVSRVCEQTGTAWERVDVDSSPALVEQFDELVPVVLVDGRQVAHWRVDEQELRRALRARRRR